MCHEMTAMITIGMLFILPAFRYCIALLSYSNSGTATLNLRAHQLYVDLFEYHFQVKRMLIKGPRTGGSILDMLDEMVKVGQVMGYNMEGCKSNMADIIRSQGVEEETKMENMNLLCVRMCWGNLDFEYARSDSVGNSGEFYGQLVLLIAVFAARDQRKATSLGLSFNSDIFSK
ncbi:hypothetical protein Tco_0598687 [Tanacetum coccineum]